MTERVPKGSAGWGEPAVLAVACVAKDLSASLSSRPQVWTTIGPKEPSRNFVSFLKKLSIPLDATGLFGSLR